MATSAGALARRKGRPEWVPTRPRERRRGRRRSGEIRATPWLGRGRGWRSGAGRGGGDVGRRTGDAAEVAGGSTVAATPLFCRRGHVSGDFPAKRRADRGRGGGCEAEGGDGATGWCSGEEGEAAGCWPAPEREKEKAGRGDAATGELGKGPKRENAWRGFHFIGEEREPGTGVVGTAAEKAAGGHGRWPGKARPFPTIGGAIQGGKRGKSKRKEWGLIPPNQFGKNGIDSRGFEGGRN
jgi:hypothetical protein|uniref:Uncharacterized protein n=1 Tax=Oryza sativa subsp. japonica TaxID=39947 RepID=Q2R2D2_ORYSJ|nr:hypothetical protein LOC_Os11g36210 [Oryza sativa Japonica Group]